MVNISPQVRRVWCVSPFKIAFVWFRFFFVSNSAGLQTIRVIGGRYIYFMFDFLLFDLDVEIVKLLT